MLTPKNLFDVFGFYEKDRFFVIKDGYYAVCPHGEPIQFESFSELPESVTQYKTHVELKKIKSGDEVTGYAGKCEVCGKVYYR